MPFDRVRADEQAGADFWVRQPLRGESGDPVLLGTQCTRGHDDATAYRLTTGSELAAGAVGEGFGADAAQHAFGRAQLASRFLGAMLTPEPLAVEQLGTSGVH